MREAACREMIATLGQYVREMRHALGWSQEHLAERARASQGLISRTERGNCLALPFLSVMKVLTALAAAEPEIAPAIPAPFRAVLACATQLPGPRVAPPDPAFARLLAAYHGLSPARRSAFTQMLLSLVEMLDEKPPAQEMTTL